MEEMSFGSLSFLGRNLHPSSSSSKAVLIYSSGALGPLLIALQDDGDSADSGDLSRF